jgi:hypothetical protein
VPHMLAQQHLAKYDAIRSGTARNQATITAALAAIGSTPTILILTMSGDGIWTLTSNLSIPSNVTLEIPLGVTINVPTGVSLAVGLVIAWNNTWKTGPGTLTKSGIATPMEISNFVCTTYRQSNSGVGTVFQVDNGLPTLAAVQIYIDQGGAATGISVSRNVANANSTWQINTILNGDLQIIRPGAGAPVVALNNNGMLLGANVSPSFLLQLATDSAAKPGTNTWTVSSDNRVKTILGDFTDGLTFLLTLPTPQRFTYNGKGGTPTDGMVCVNMIAQDVQAVAPDWVRSYDAKLEETDSQTTAILSTNTSNLIFVVMNAIKELAGRVTALETP